MFRYILNRIILGFFTVFALLLIIYFLQATQGRNPIIATSVDVTPPPGQTLEQFLNAKLEAAGFNQPIIVRFGLYVAGVFRDGNFGPIYTDVNLTPQTAFFGPLRFSILVTGPVFLISTVLGIAVGVLAAYNRGKLLDTIVNIFTNVFIGLPAFIIAPIAILIAVNIGLPSSFIRPEVGNNTTTQLVLSLITPISVSVLSSLAIFMIYTRNQMVTVLTSNHVLIAKTKGLSRSQIFFKHIMRNASLPVLGLVIPSFTILLSGNIIIEQFFGVPGSSTLITQFFSIGEIHVIMFFALFFSVLSQVITIFIDSLFVVVDPTIKFAKASQGNNRFSFMLSNMKKKVMSMEIFDRSRISHGNLHELKPKSNIDLKEDES